ncbi:MerR family transcriptional regulator [Niallia nealsonii]|uniref:MerR family transcriptional regulator n=1 Tax=Niallia nealsonii TaxID=115979 RepID=UPI001F161008|nr:MerR family transcriptional regulator [Niallia nealsonii]
MRIGKVAELSELSVRTIDYYTQNGLLETQRSSSNYRLYSEDVIHTLERIKLLKQQRMSIQEIKQALKSNVPMEIEPIISDVQDEIHCLQKKLSILEEKLKHVSQEEKIRVYNRIEPNLSAIMTLMTLL